MTGLLALGKTVGWSSLMRMRRVKRKVWEDLISPHFVLRCVQTLLNVGFLDALRKGPRCPVAFATENRLDPKLMLALCEALYARKVLTREGDRFGLDKTGRLIVETNLGRGWIELVFGYESALHNLEPLLRNQVAYGQGVVRDGKFVGTGSGLASLDFYFPLVRELIAGGKRRRILDIGCGDGTFLRYICSVMPEIEGVGIDLSPDAVETGAELVRSEGLEKRVRLLVADASDIGSLKCEIAGVDAATTFFVLHELCDGDRNHRAVAFLRSFREALPGVPFHVVETVRPSVDAMRRRPGPAVEYFLFHDLSGQNPIGRQEWRKLYEMAGFQSVKEDYVAFARTSIYTLS